MKGAPSMVLMTTNITRFMMDVGEVLLGNNLAQAAEARRRARRAWPAIVGFTASSLALM